MSVRFEVCVIVMP